MNTADAAPRARATLLSLSALLAIQGCSSGNAPAPLTVLPPPPQLIEPIATIQDLMQSEVDASADAIWDSVETTISKHGEQVRQPRTSEEWAAVRRHAIVLVEAGNLLVVGGRRLSAAPFPAEATGALDSVQIEQRIAANRQAFDQFALALRSTARDMLHDIDTKDPTALVKDGGALDAICEACHLRFWYPDQLIPELPAANDPRYYRSR